MKLHFILFLMLSVTTLTLAQENSDSYYKPIVPPKKNQAPANTKGYTLPESKAYAESINAADLKESIEILASDELAGRKTGETGSQKAADYLAGQLKLIDLKMLGDRNNYMQIFDMQHETWAKLSLKVGERSFENGKDFYVFPAFNPDQPTISLKEVVFVGFGIDDPKYSDYGKTEVAGKAVIFYAGEPMDKNGVSLITGSDFRSEWSLDWKKKVELAKQKGATMVFVIDPAFENSLKTNSKLLGADDWTAVSGSNSRSMAKYCNFMFISTGTATAILGKKAAKAEDAMSDLKDGEKFKPVKVKSAIEVQMDKENERVNGLNVVGMVEGSDPQMKKEYVVFVTHYDYKGTVDGAIMYGADDNASGVAATLEIARAYAAAAKAGKGPKRSVVFLFTGGGEQGMLGSRFYAKFPIVPLDKTVAAINLDQVGRADQKHASDPNYVYITGTDRISIELDNIYQEVNDTYTKLTYDQKHNVATDPEKLYENSECYFFAQKSVPSIRYFDGQSPDFEKVTDTADKIDYPVLTKRAQLAFYTSWDIANRPWRLTIDYK